MPNQPQPTLPANPQARTVHSVLIDIEDVGTDINRLALAVEIVGAYAKIDGLDPQCGGGIEVLGEIINERTAKLVELYCEGLRLNAERAHG